MALEGAIAPPSAWPGSSFSAPGLSGAPVPELDPDTARLDRLLDAAAAAGDLEEVNRLEMWLWLDGPSQPEGRVGGATRALALEMNRRMPHATVRCIEGVAHLSELERPGGVVAPLVELLDRS